MKAFDPIDRDCFTVRQIGDVPCAGIGPGLFTLRSRDALRIQMVMRQTQSDDAATSLIHIQRGI